MKKIANNLIKVGISASIFMMFSCQKEKIGTIVDKEFTPSAAFVTSGGFQQVNPAKYILFVDYENEVYEKKVDKTVYFEKQIGDTFKLN